jgi:hypothetical protein
MPPFFRLFSVFVTRFFAVLYRRFFNFLTFFVTRFFAVLYRRFLDFLAFLLRAFYPFCFSEFKSPPASDMSRINFGKGGIL